MLNSCIRRVLPSTRLNVDLRIEEISWHNQAPVQGAMSTDVAKQPVLTGIKAHTMQIVRFLHSIR